MSAPIAKPVDIKKSLIDMVVAGLLDLLDHQALHARTLGFVHPVTRERVFFEAQPPADFREAIARLEDYYGGS